MTSFMKAVAGILPVAPKRQYTFGKGGSEIVGKECEKQNGKRLLYA